MFRKASSFMERPKITLTTMRQNDDYDKKKPPSSPQLHDDIIENVDHLWKHSYNMNHLLSLPDDLFPLIAQYLTIRDEMHLSLTCKTLQALHEMVYLKNFKRYTLTEQNNDIDSLRYILNSKACVESHCSNR